MHQSEIEDMAASQTYIPPEIVGVICSFLRPSERLPYRRVSRTWLYGSRIHTFCSPTAKAYFQHIADGNLPAIRFVLASGADIHAHNDFAIVLAARFGRAKLVKWLCAEGLSPNAEHGNGFIEACENGDLALAKWFRARGCSITAQFGSGYRGACYGGHLDIMKWLHEEGGDEYADSSGTMRNMTHSGEGFATACGGGKRQAAEWLYAQGPPDLNWCSGAALRRARKAGHVGIQKWLEGIMQLPEEEEVPPG